jgi:hypothetical protein
MHARIISWTTARGLLSLFSDVEALDVAAMLIRALLLLSCFHTFHFPTYSTAASIIAIIWSALWWFNKAAPLRQTAAQAPHPWHMAGWTTIRRCSKSTVRAP